jgi:hypothetical protein
MCGDTALPVGYIKLYVSALTNTHINSYFDACISTHTGDKGRRHIEPSTGGR